MKVASKASDKAEERLDRRMAFAIGIALVVGLVIIALVVPNPTASQERTFTITLGLAAGAWGCFFPGDFGLRGRLPGLVIRATKAIAFAAFVMLVYRLLL